MRYLFIIVFLFLLFNFNYLHSDVSDSLLIEKIHEQEIRIAKLEAAMKTVPEKHSYEYDERRFDLGLGYGGLYGYTGLNIDFSIIKLLNIFVGVGLGPPSPPTNIGREDEYEGRWAAGLRLHTIFSYLFFRPRITIFYGINSTTQHQRFAENGQQLGYFDIDSQGWTIGTGFKLMFGESRNFGIDFDIFYALTIDSFIDQNLIDKYFHIVENEEKKISFSLGLRYAFDLW